MSRLRSHLNGRLVLALFVLAGSASLLAYAATSTTTRTELGTTSDQTAVRTSRDVSTLPLRSACTVQPRKELFITDLSVVNDCVRTTWGPCISPPVAPATQGAWTFGARMASLAGTNDPATLSSFTLNWLNHWLANQTINSDPVPARPSAQAIIDQWRNASGSKTLDMKKAPFRLLAIVARLDLRENSGYTGGGSTAGEGRFIYGLLDAFGNPSEFLVIFEYGLDAKDCFGVQDWAHAWHGLGSLAFGANYNAALQTVTDRFATIGASPGKPNGSAINQVRTNEIHLQFPWELREFKLNDRVLVVPSPLSEVVVAQTPARSLQETPPIASYVNANAPAILAHQHVVPLSWGGAPFKGGASPHNLELGWDGPNPVCTSITDPEARHAFSLDTCSGCHGQETGVRFYHVEPRTAGAESTLSSFLLGGSQTDRCGRTHNFGDIERRRVDLCQLLDKSCSQIDAEPVVTFVH
ncbi:MAG: hypothetical protein ACJ75H_04800 [Thermoanaerobaculia bacterium]